MTYRILSPDGFDIAYDETYSSIKEVRTALKAFVANYTHQGYYSTADREHIDLKDLPERCELITVTN